MDVQMTITTGGGKKANRMSHSYTAKEVQTMEEVVQIFREQFDKYFPKYQTLEEPGRKGGKK